MASAATKKKDSVPLRLPVKSRMLVATALAAALSGCSNNLDALYAGGHDGGTAEDALPLLPATPDERFVDACEACAASQCKDERASCLADDACTAQLRCKGSCSDPACLERCEVDHTRSAWYDDYLQCVFEAACAVPCGRGQSFECLGNYAVRSGAASSYAVTWHFDGYVRSDDPVRSTNNLSPLLEGASVRACNALSSDCGSAGAAQGIAAIDAYDDAQMTVEGSPFRGYLELSGGPYDERALLYRQPTSGSEWREVGMAPRLDFLSFGPGLGVGDAFKAPHHANLAFIALDCLRERAPGVHFAEGGRSFASIAYIRMDSTGDEEGPTSSTGTALATSDLGGDATREVVVEVRDDQDAVLSTHRVFLRDGWSTQIELLPREQGEQ